MEIAVAGHPDLKAARNHPELERALAEAGRVAGRCEKPYPKVAKPIRDQFEETMSVYDPPREHRRKLYTSNMIERVMAEVKHRTRVVGIFPNEVSADRLIGAHLSASPICGSAYLRSRVRGEDEYAPSRPPVARRIALECLRGP